VRDGTHDSPKYHDSGIPLVTSKNLLPDGIEFSNVKFISREDYEQIAKRSAVSDGDILFAMIGTIGNATVVSGGHPFAIKNVALFRTFGNLVLANFLRYWLNSPYTGSFFKDHQKGSSQPFAPLNLLRSLPVPFPPLAEQQEIVRLVEALFALADQLEARYAKARAYVEKLTQSILAKAFRGELVPQDPNDEPAEALLRRIHQPSKNGKKA
jgi:type I restriction enzyme S subunit